MVHGAPPCEPDMLIWIDYLHRPRGPCHLCFRASHPLLRLGRAPYVFLLVAFCCSIAMLVVCIVIAGRTSPLLWSMIELAPLVTRSVELLYLPLSAISFSWSG